MKLKTENLCALATKTGPVHAAAYLLLILALLFLDLTGLAPLNKMRELESQVMGDTLFMEQYKPAFDHPGLQGLVRDNAYTEALLDLSETDSIQLALNLADSTVGLYIHGVNIHRARIGSYKIDGLLTGLPNMQFVKIFSKPLAVNNQNATIVKEPVVVRQAPKDTIEAALNAWQPDTLIQNPAFLQLKLDYGIGLVMEQDQNPRLKDQWVRFRFRSGIGARQFFHGLGNFFTLRKQEYVPCIVIRIPADDLRAIYRALPDKAYVVVHYLPVPELSN
jgi:hypothetical protein